MDNPDKKKLWEILGLQINHNIQNTLHTRNPKNMSQRHLATKKNGLIKIQFLSFFLPVTENLPYKKKIYRALTINPEFLFILINLVFYCHYCQVNIL